MNYFAIQLSIVRSEEGGLDRVIDEKVATITELRSSIERRKALLEDNGSQEMSPSAPTASASAYNGQYPDISYMSVSSSSSRARPKER